MIDISLQIFWLGKLYFIYTQIYTYVTTTELLCWQPLGTCCYSYENIWVPINTKNVWPFRFNNNDLICLHRMSRAFHMRNNEKRLVRPQRRAIRSVIPITCPRQSVHIDWQDSVYLPSKRVWRVCDVRSVTNRISVNFDFISAALFCYIVFREFVCEWREEKASRSKIYLFSNRSNAINYLYYTNNTI